MRIQSLNLLRILLNPGITRTPMRVLRELRRRGKPRVPEAVANEDGLHRGSALKFIRKWLDGEHLTRHRGQWVVNSFLPPFPGPAFDRMFENLLSGRRLSPVSAYLGVTARCSYNCWHCSFRDRAAKDLPTSEWEGILDELLGLGVSIVGFTGGEPCRRNDLTSLVRKAADGGAATIVFTSGDQFTPELAAELKAAGLWAVGVSLDSADPARCNELRGVPHAFAAANRAIRLARKSGFYTMTGTVATRELVESGDHRRIHRLAGELGAHEFRLIEAMPCGELRNVSSDNLLTRDHVEELRRFHVETNRKGAKPKVCAFNQVESPEFFGCGAGTQHLFIDSAAEVCPCDFTPLSFGNATQAPLAEIWNRMNDAMGNPRRHCFIQKHHQLVAGHNSGPSPAPCGVSEEVCACAGREPLPEFFRFVSSGGSPGPAPEGDDDDGRGER